MQNGLAIWRNKLISSGTQLEAGRWTRAWECKLAIAQRTGNKVRTRAIHAKIKS